MSGICLHRIFSVLTLIKTVYLCLLIVECRSENSEAQGN